MCITYSTWPVSEQTWMLILWIFIRSSAILTSNLFSIGLYIYCVADVGTAVVLAQPFLYHKHCPPTSKSNLPPRCTKHD